GPELVRGETEAAGGAMIDEEERTDPHYLALAGAVEKNKEEQQVDSGLLEERYDDIEECGGSGAGGRRRVRQHAAMIDSHTDQHEPHRAEDRHPGVRHVQARLEDAGQDDECT